MQIVWIRKVFTSKQKVQPSLISKFILSIIHNSNSIPRFIKRVNIVITSSHIASISPNASQSPHAVPFSLTLIVVLVDFQLRRSAPCGPTVRALLRAACGSTRAPSRSSRARTKATSSDCLLPPCSGTQTGTRTRAARGTSAISRSSSCAPSYSYSLLLNTHVHWTLIHMWSGRWNQRGTMWSAWACRRSACFGGSSSATWRARASWCARGARRTCRRSRSSAARPTCTPDSTRCLRTSPRCSGSPRSSRSSRSTPSPAAWCAHTAHRHRIRALAARRSPPLYQIISVDYRQVHYSVSTLQYISQARARKIT